MQKHVNLVDIVKSFPTNIFLQMLASIQKRTSPLKFDHLAEKSEYGSISNLSTEVAFVAGLTVTFAALTRGSPAGPASSWVSKAKKPKLPAVQKRNAAG